MTIERNDHAAYEQKGTKTLISLDSSKEEEPE